MDEELILQQELIRSPPLPYKDLIRHEWGDFGGGGSSATATPTAHIGKGDLVFRRPLGHDTDEEDYLVVETKHLRTDTGATARTSRTASRRKVIEQALRYGAIWRGYLGTEHGTVTMATYTNESKHTDDGVEDGGTDGDQLRQLQTLGRMDYLTPHLLGKSSWQEALSLEDVAILEQERLKRPFMVARIKPLCLSIDPKDHTTTSTSIHDYLVHFGTNNGDAWQQHEVDQQVQPLEEVADSVLNHSGFYQPFAPHFIVARSSTKEVLQKLRVCLRRLKR